VINVMVRSLEELSHHFGKSLLEMVGQNFLVEVAGTTDLPACP